MNITEDRVLRSVVMSSRHGRTCTHAVLRNYMKVRGETETEELNLAIRKAISNGLIMAKKTEKMYGGAPVYILFPTEISIKNKKIQDCTPWEETP